MQIRRERTKKKLSKREKELGAEKKGQSSASCFGKGFMHEPGGWVSITETMMIDFPHFSPPSIAVI